MMPRRLLPLSVCIALIPATLPLMAAAQSAVPFDAYIAGGDASCLELTVSTGYSFVVEPDARLPRATAMVSEGSAGALAAPADPGDSVDALAGLMVPRVENQVTGQMPQGVGSAVQRLANPVNPIVEYPYEHASAAYPNPRQPGDQQASYLGVPSASFSDPSGVVSVDGAAGDARAGAVTASADSGAGAATSLPALGISAGRLSATSVAQVATDRVTDDVACTMQDVSIAPPGSGFTLHIGTLAAALHTERRIGAAAATETHALQVADLTVNGNDVLPPGQGNLPLQPMTVQVPQPPALPGVPPPASLQSIALTGTTGSDAPGAGGNEETSTLTAATVVITSTAPVPSSVPPAPGQNPVATTPVVYTLRLAALDSQTYGLAAATTATGALPAGGAVVSNGGGGGAFGGAGGFTGGPVGTAPKRATTGTAATKPVNSMLNVPGMPPALRWSVVALALLAEAALLTTLYLRSRRAARAAPNAAPAAFVDLP